MAWVDWHYRRVATQDVIGQAWQKPSSRWIFKEMLDKGCDSDDSFMCQKGQVGYTNLNCHMCHFRLAHWKGSQCRNYRRSCVEKRDHFSLWRTGVIIVN